MENQKMEESFGKLSLIHQATVHNVINHLMEPEASFFGQKRNEYVSSQCYFCHELFISLQKLEEHEQKFQQVKLQLRKFQA